MNIQVRAALDTVLFIVYITAITLGTYLFLSWSGPVGLYLAIAAIAAVLIHMVYSISLTRRQYLEDKNK